MYRTDRSIAHQALRDLLASMVSEVKRDRKRMSPPDVAFDLGYMCALTYAIKVEVQNTMTWGHEHDHLRKDVQQCKDLVDRLNGGVAS